MADGIVDLGSFTFDGGDVDKYLEKVTGSMYDLRAESKKYADETRENEKQLKKYAEVQKLLDNGNEANAKSLKENAEKMKALNERNKELYSSSQKVKDEQKKLSAEYREATKMANSLSDADGKRVTSTQAITTAIERENKSIADTRASNKELLALRNQLDISGGKNADTLADLNAALDKNNAFIKENVSEYEQQKIGIGDYQNAIEAALGGTKLFGVGISDLKGVLNQFTPILDLLKKQVAETTAAQAANKAATEGMSGAQKAAFITTQTLVGGLKLLRVALIATGIGAIVVVLGSLIAYLSTTQAGIDAVTKVTRPLAAVFQRLLGVFQEIGGEVFENPLGALEKMKDFVVKQLTESFQGLGKIIEGVFTLNQDKIKEGADQIKKLADDNAKALKEQAKGIQEAWDIGSQIDQLQKEIEDSQLAYNRQLEITNRLIDEQTLKSKDTSLNMKEREEAAQEIIRLTKELGLQEEGIIEKKIKQLGLQQSLNDTSREGQQEMIDLENDLSQAQNRGTKEEIVQLRVISQARKEAATQANQAAKEAQDRAIKDSQDRLALFQAEQGFRKKSADEEIAIAERTRDELLAIERQKLAANKDYNLQYQAEIIKINDDFLQLQLELVIDNAERERDLELKAIEARKNDLQLFTQERLDLERENIADRLEVEQEFFDLQLENGIINQVEYDDAIAELKEEARISEQEAVFAFEQAVKDAKFIDAENQRILDEQEFSDKFELDKFRLEQRRQAEIEAAEKTGASIALINEKYANLAIEIEKRKEQGKQQLIKQSFDIAVGLLGKESALGKAVALAQALWNTYQGITAGVALGYPMAIPAVAAATVTGFAAVKNITSTKMPKAEKGMLLRGNSHKQGGIHIEAEGGEAIINKRSTAMFSGLLSQINMAGGGIPLAARGMIAGNSSRSSGIQSQLMKGAMSDNMAQIIADTVGESVMEAAETGTRRGSQSGIIGLSENRQVQQSSSF